jgi:hypothetical protein
MSTVILDSERSGIRSTVLVDQDHKRPVIRTHQDTAPILEANKRIASDYDPTWQNNRMRLRRVASVPVVIMQQLAKSGIVEMRRSGGYRVIDERAFLRLLSDPEFRWLRTDDGRRLA